MQKKDREVFTRVMRQIGGKGGKTRAKKLTAEERRAIAKKGAAARWAKKK